MATLGDNQNWSSIPKENLSSKYEKCLNITEEIYKRINITFQIRKLETGSQSDVSEHSDQIDSNDLSNETDLFACDKTDSLPSSEPEPQRNNNNDTKNNKNNSEKKTVLVYKKPKKRFRKRVKKRVSRASDSDGSSDEGTPLSQVGVPCYVALTKDVKPKILTSEKSQSKKSVTPSKQDSKSDQQADKLSKEAAAAIYDFTEENVEVEIKKEKSCNMCSMSFKADRGLRRHIAKSHSIVEEKTTRTEREVKPA